MAHENKLIRAAKVTTGVVMLPVGVALLVLPGPGIPVVLGSLALLKDELPWAGKTLNGITLLARRGRDWLENRALLPQSLRGGEPAHSASDPLQQPGAEDQAQQRLPERA